MVQALYIDSSNTLIQDLAARKSGDNFFTLKEGKKISDFRPVIQTIFDRLQKIDTTKASLEDLQKAAHTIRTIHAGAKKQLCFWRNTGEWLLAHIPFFNRYATKSYCDRSYTLLQKAAARAEESKLQKLAQGTDKAAQEFFKGAQIQSRVQAKTLKTISAKPLETASVLTWYPLLRAFEECIQNIEALPKLAKLHKNISGDNKTLKGKLLHFLSRRSRKLLEKRAALHGLEEIKTALKTKDQVEKVFFNNAKNRHVYEIVAPQVGHFLSIVRYMLKQHPEFEPMMEMFAPQEALIRKFFKNEIKLTMKMLFPQETEVSAFASALVNNETDFQHNSLFSGLFNKLQTKPPIPSEKLLKVKEYHSLFLPEWQKLQKTFSHFEDLELKGYTFMMHTSLLMFLMNS